MKLHIIVPICDLLVTIDLSGTVSEILTTKAVKKKNILFSAGGPDAPNDLILLSIIESLSSYHMPKK